MAPARRRCLFCGRPGSSREHIIAKWIGRTLKPDPIPGTVIRFRHEFANPEAGIGLREKSAANPAYYTRAFCRNCNTGWMAELENAVKPVLEPMLKGQRRLVTSVAAHTLSFWASKTILAFQAAESPTTTFARPEDFRRLHDEQAAPQHSQIWLAAVRQGDAFQYRAHSVLRTGKASDKADGFGASLILGHVAFYFLMGFSEPLGLCLGASISRALREIQPQPDSDFSWPATALVQPHPEYALTELIVNNSRSRPTPPGR